MMELRTFTACQVKNKPDLAQLANFSISPSARDLLASFVLTQFYNWLLVLLKHEHQLRTSLPRCSTHETVREVLLFRGPKTQGIAMTIRHMESSHKHESH